MSGWLFFMVSPGMNFANLAGKEKSSSWAMIIVWAMADVGARFIAPLQGRDESGRNESRPYCRNDDHGQFLLIS